MKRIRYIEYLPIIAITLAMYFVVINPALISQVFKVMRPILWGVAISYIMNPLAKWVFNRFKISWGFSIMISYLSIIILLGIIAIILIPVLAKNLSSLIQKTPDILKEINRLIEQLELYFSKQAGSGEAIDFSYIINKTTEMTGIMITSLSNSMIIIIKGFFQIFMGFVISIYLLFSKERIKETGYRFLKIKLSIEKRHIFMNFINKADRTFSGFLIGKLIDSLIIGIIAFVGFLFLKVPFAPLMAIIIGITNMIPYFGPFIGGIPVVIITSVISPMGGIWTALFILVLQQIDGYFIGPKILGDSIGVSPFWVIMGVVIGGGFFGVVGMILGVPTLAILHSEFKDYLVRNEIKEV